MVESEIFIILISAIIIGSAIFLLPSQEISIPPTPAYVNITTSNDTIQAPNYTGIVNFVGVGMTVSGNNETQTIYFIGNGSGSSSTDTNIVVYPLLTGIGNYTTPNAAVESSSTSTSSTLFNDTFSSYTTQAAADLAWPNTNADTVDIVNDNLYWVNRWNSTDKQIYHDLGNPVSGTKWILRFKITPTSLATDNCMLVGISNSTAGVNTKQNFIGMAYRYHTSFKDQSAESYYNTGDSACNVQATVTDTPTNGVSRWIQLNRSASNSFNLKVYSESTFTTQVGSTVTATPSASIANLRYIKVMDRNTSGGAGGTSTGTIDDVQFWNNTNSVSSGSSTGKEVDNNTLTAWSSLSQINPWSYVDMGSAVNLAGAAMFWNASSTSTQILIQTSTDTSNWNTKRTVNTNLLIDNSWNFIRWDLDSTTERYVRFYGNDATAKQLSFYELKILKPTDSLLLLNHGHKSISTSDGTLPLNT